MYLFYEILLITKWFFYNVPRKTNLVWLFFLEKYQNQDLYYLNLITKYCSYIILCNIYNDNLTYLSRCNFDNADRGSVIFGVSDFPQDFSNENVPARLPGWVAELSTEKTCRLAMTKKIFGEGLEGVAK